jgi:competence protein ComEC
MLGARPAGLLLQALVLAGFCALAGMRPPLLRATLGWALLAWSWSAGRRCAGLPRLGVVALLVLVAQPGAQAELSAQLSFAAVAGLVAAARLGRGPLVFWLAPAGAFLATAPLAAEVFGRVQPWGVLVTPLLLPWVAALLLAGLPAVLPGDAARALDGFTGPALQTLATGLERSLEELAVRLPPPLHPPPPPLPGWLLSALVVAALWTLGAGRGGPRAGRYLERLP